MYNPIWMPSNVLTCYHGQLHAYLPFHIDVIYMLCSVQVTNNGDGLCTMVMQMKDKLENYAWLKKEEGKGKQQLIGPEAATSRCIADLEVA